MRAFGLCLAVLGGITVACTNGGAEHREARAAEPITPIARAPVGDEELERSRASEPLYLRAVHAAQDGATEHAAVLDALSQALRAGACPTRALTDSAFGELHELPRFRQLIREHARQSATRLTLADEEGEPLHVFGAIRDANGQPIADALVYVFQTDSRGLYSAGGMDESNPRIFGYIRTDSEGRYAFDTIRPGHYPDQREPVEQHIHYEVSAAGFAKRIWRLGFEDDPHWRGRTPPRWARPVKRAQGATPSCEMDIVLEREQG